MFKQLRQLNMSLAAKCQLLFGAAVVLIIAAALFVPWQRMEQLTGQLNERTASALARSAVADHITLAAQPGRRASPATAPTTEPTTLPGPGAQAYHLPRLLPASSLRDPHRSTPFERRALAYFIKPSDNDYFARDYKRDDGTQGYRYARALYNGPDCAQCHSEASASAGDPDPKSTGQNPKPQLLGIVSVDIPSQIEPNQLLLNHVFILSAGALAGTLAIIVFYLIITHLILQPVRVLQETAEKVSEGDLNIRSDINTRDEFQQLSETFNTMLTNLKAGEDQLRAINTSLDLKLEQMAESNVALYESNRLKSEFLANVSHELRTPLNSILGFAELLKDSVGKAPADTAAGIAGADAKTGRYIQNILSSGNNLLDLINDLLDLAKIEAGRMDVRSEPLSLSDLFEGLSSILKPLAESKDLTLITTVAADVPILQTDPAKLQQVLYNFLANAIKFSPPGAQIDLTAQRENEQIVRISVTDHGPGIQPEQQEIIFEKFRQIDGSVTRQHSGTGLGLAISKELVLLLGGSIGVRSALGQGATFWVLLPLKIQAGTQDLRGKLVLT